MVTEADAVRGRVSLTGQYASVDEDLTGSENLVMLARLLGYHRKQAKARAGELLSAFDLTGAAGRQAKTYSGGMRRRLDIAASISKGVFDRFRTLPIWTPSALVGALLGDVVRYAAASTLVVALGLALGYRPDGGFVGVILAVAVVLAFSFSLGWLWNLLGLVLRTPNAVMGASMMILFPLTFASNISRP